MPSDVCRGEDRGQAGGIESVGDDDVEGEGPTWLCQQEDIHLDVVLAVLHHVPREGADQAVKRVAALRFSDPELKRAPVPAPAAVDHPIGPWREDLTLAADSHRVWAVEGFDDGTATDVVAAKRCPAAGHDRPLLVMDDLEGATGWR